MEKMKLLGRSTDYKSFQNIFIDNRVINHARRNFLCNNKHTFLSMKLLVISVILVFTACAMAFFVYKQKKRIEKMERILN